MGHKILELKRWQRVTYQPDGPDGAEIRMELKRLKRHEAKPLHKVMVEAFAELERGMDKGLTSAKKAAIMAAVWDVVPEEQLGEIFAGSVRAIEGLKIDNTAITRGDELLEEADDDLLFFVLTNLQALSALSDAEAFLSASRSTSSVETARRPESPGSDASSTGNGDGPSPSAATEGAAASSVSGAAE